MALKDLPLDMRNALSRSETPENRTIRSMLHLSDRWYVLGETVVSDHPTFDDEHSDVPLPEKRDADPKVSRRKSRYSGECVIHIAAKRRDRYLCPECGKPCCVASYERRRYRHLDRMGYKCYLDVHLPKFLCTYCGGTPQLRFPASNPNSRHTRNSTDTS